MIDIIMQSVIMNLGSGGTYNSLIDTREKGKFNGENSGLCDVEINFVQDVLTEIPIFHSIYQVNDNHGYKLIKPKNEIKNDIAEALKNNENIVVGYIFGDNENGYSGHEVTIIGETTNINGKAYYICQDSDDDCNTPKTISQEYILSNIHHAIFSDKDHSKYKKHTEELMYKFQLEYAELQQNIQTNFVEGNPFLPAGMPMNLYEQNTYIPMWMPINPIEQNVSIPVKVPLKQEEQNIFMPIGTPMYSVEQNPFILIDTQINTNN